MSTKTPSFKREEHYTWIQALCKINFQVLFCWVKNPDETRLDIECRKGKSENHVTNSLVFVFQPLSSDPKHSDLTATPKRSQYGRMKSITSFVQKLQKHTSTCGDSHMIRNIESGDGRQLRYVYYSVILPLFVLICDLDWSRVNVNLGCSRHLILHSNTPWLLIGPE